LNPGKRKCVCSKERDQGREGEVEFCFTGGRDAEKTFFPGGETSTGKTEKIGPRH